MKILLISYYFPPFNAVGAVRTGKLAKYLIKLGHEVKVLTARNQPWLPDLPVEIEESHITRTAWIDINKPVQLLLGGRKSVATKGFERAGKLPGFVKKMGFYYKNIVNFPDGQIGWYPFALRAGKRLLREWRPNFILSSFSPATSLLLGKKLAKEFNVPWIADLRDLWSDNHNTDIYSSITRKKIDRKMEKWVLSTATGLITVSEPLAAILTSKFDKPVGVITNGYDLEDYPKPSSQNQPILKIVYTGIIHPVKRDPAPLFEALALFSKELNKVKVDFYGRSNAIVAKAAEQYGLQDIVHCYDTVSYQQSLQQQVDADILLLLTFNADKEKGVITTKFFEYLGAKKTILLIGCVDGVAAKLIKERKIGLASNNPEEIAIFLQQQLQNKLSGNPTELEDITVKGFSREEQASQLVAFLQHIESHAGRLDSVND